MEVERVLAEAVDKAVGLDVFPDAVPGCSFFGKYRQIGECIDYRWKPPPCLRNVEAMRANFAARIAFCSF